jgi:hypothetical protein
MGRLRHKGIGGAVPSRPPHDRPRDKRGQEPGSDFDPPQHDAGSRQRATAEKPTGSLDPRLSPRAQHERQDRRKTEAVMAGTTKPNSPLPSESATRSSGPSRLSRMCSPEARRRRGRSPRRPLG